MKKLPPKVISGKLGSFPKSSQHQSIAFFRAAFAYQGVPVHSIGIESGALDELFSLGSRLGGKDLVLEFLIALHFFHKSSG
jgi:hypothetical protein